MAGKKEQELSFHALTPDRWADFEKLFGPGGAHGGCWCQWFKQTNAEFDRRHGPENRRLMKRSAEADVSPGVLAYDQDAAVGWCAVEPRENYPRLARSRILKPVDDEAVWSITCFFIARTHRKRGLTEALLEAAVDHVKKQGGRIVEAYPVDPDRPRIPTADAYHGIASTFLRQGFEKVAARKPTRPILRLRLRE